jgi:MFS family permease
MVPWLVVGVLRASPEATGMVQTAASLPNLLLLLVGGALADRADARRLLARLHRLAALPPLALAACAATGHLSLPVVTASAMALGVLNGLAYPARDSLLSRVAGEDVMRAVTGNTIAQFGSQGIGMLVAGAARWVGSPAVLLAQAVCMGAGSLSARRLPERAEGVAAAHAPGPSGLFAGLRFVWGSDLRAVLVLVTGIGLLFNGSYYVLMPLAVRDVYAGDVRQVSLLLFMFPVGAISGSLLLLARGGVERKGLGLALALAAAGLCLVVAGLGLPFPAFVATTLAWGLAGSVFLNTSRTLFQSRAPAAERARVLAVSQLGFTLAGPVGATTSGYAAAHLGPLAALSAFGVGMLTLVGLTLLLTPVARMR